MCGTQLALINLSVLAFSVDKWGRFNRPSVAALLPMEALMSVIQGRHCCRIKIAVSASFHVLVSPRMTQTGRSGEYSH